jgi:hypothetical protein
MEGTKVQSQAVHANLLKLFNFIRIHVLFPVIEALQEIVFGAVRSSLTRIGSRDLFILDNFCHNHGIAKALDSPTHGLDKCLCLSKMIKSNKGTSRALSMLTRDPLHGSFNTPQTGTV